MRLEINHMAHLIEFFIPKSDDCRRVSFVLPMQRYNIVV